MAWIQNEGGGYDWEIGDPDTGADDSASSTEGYARNIIGPLGSFLFDVGSDLLLGHGGTDAERLYGMSIKTFWMTPDLNKATCLTVIDRRF